MPPSLNIDSGSIEIQALSAYLTAVNPITDDQGFSKMSAEQFVETLHKVRSMYSLDRIDTFRDKVQKNDAEMGKKYLDNILAYGAPTWYDWRVKNWGTKWNAYSQEPIKDNKICFETAWSKVTPIMLKLSERFPELEMRYRWADEDIGANLGEQVFANGKMQEQFIPSTFSKEAFEFAADMWGLDLEKEGYFFDEKMQTYKYDLSKNMELNM